MRSSQALINHEHEHFATHETQRLPMTCGLKQDIFHWPYIRFPSRLTDVTIWMFEQSWRRFEAQLSTNMSLVPSDEQYCVEQKEKLVLFKGATEWGIHCSLWQWGFSLQIYRPLTWPSIHSHPKHYEPQYKLQETMWCSQQVACAQGIVNLHIEPLVCWRCLWTLERHSSKSAGPAASFIPQAKFHQNRQNIELQ